MPWFRRFCLLSATTLTFSANAEHAADEELQVTATREIHRIDVADFATTAPDSATLLRQAPGGNSNGNGPITNIPQYRGMYGSRINVQVNGTTLSSAGPNWMDPPLHYAPAAQLQSLEVYRGIAPVSAGQETIGGAINAKTWTGEFGNSEDFETQGRINLGGQSVNGGSLINAAAVLSNNSHRIKLSALNEAADDAEFDGGEIIPSEYDRSRYDLAYGYRNGSHELSISAGRNETGDSGTAALPMDIEYIDGDLADIQYQFETDTRSYSIKFYQSELEHGMTNYHLRQPPMMPSMWRRNIAASDNSGFAISVGFKTEHSNWTFGIDQHSETHDSDIDNPNNPMFFLVNFNEAEREVTGVFVELEQEFTANFSAEFGLRANSVEMDAAQVNGTPAMMMPPARMLRDHFNNADRSQSDDNIDIVAKFYYESGAWTPYFGLAQKTRSASYQERYLWLPLEATAGLADGRTYIGNITLEPEVAQEVEFGFDYQGDFFSATPRIFYRQVDDYIQGTPAMNMAAAMFVDMMRGPTAPEPLQFNNVDATFQGMDMDWQYTLNSHWSLGGVINYIKAERDDIDDNLYRIAPLNGSIRLNYQSSSWGFGVENVLYSGQDDVSQTNGELATPGYGLLNISGHWDTGNNLRLGFGIENTLDRRYTNHLGGYNRAMNPDVPMFSRLPSFGRSLYVRLDYQW